jgi:hypothetical protein
MTFLGRHLDMPEPLSGRAIGYILLVTRHIRSRRIPPGRKVVRQSWNSFTALALMTVFRQLGRTIEPGCSLEVCLLHRPI